MAKVAEVNETGEATSTKSKAKPSIMVVLPTELLELVKRTGEDNNKPNSRIVAEAVAEKYGYTLPEMQRARRTEDGTGMNAKVKNQAIELLLEKAKAGEIVLTDDLKALLGIGG